MPGRLPIYRSLPDPWRGRIGLRRARRWMQAVLYARRHNARQPAGAPTLNFFPMRPGPNSSMVHILSRFPVRIGHSAAGGQPTFAWDTGTWFSPADAARLPADAINRRCLDIAKSTVDRIWGEVAGYSITVEPLEYSGEMVEKPDLNGMHAGRVVSGPLHGTREGMVYQRLIDSRADDGRILQLRAVIIDSRIVFTYAKWRPYPQWFKGTELTEPRPSPELLSADEASVLLRFADAIGLEYGELDILRDQDGRIYVVDANRTPVRPKGLPLAAEDAAFEPQAQALARLISEWGARSARSS